MAYTKGSCALAAVVALAAMGCASSPAAPFNQLEASNLTALRLQNYEPPAVVPGLPQAGQMGIPAPVQQWIQQGAQGLQQLIPPGLLPPGLLPQGDAQAQQPGAQPTAPVVDNTPRFHGFRILGQTQVMDSNLRADLADILGDEDNFGPQHSQCLYAELGLSFGSMPGGPTNDVLISFSCNQVAATSFAWPHTYTGMTSDTVQAMAEVVQRIFPPGT